MTVQNTYKSLLNIQARPVDICYYVAFGIYSFFHLYEATNYESFLFMQADLASKTATALMLVLLVPRLLSLRYNLDGFCKTVALLFAGILVFLTTKSWICFSLALFICAGHGLNVRHLIQISLYTTLLVFLVTVLGVQSGWIETIVSYRPGEVRLRDSCGFSQVNVVGNVAARVCTAVALLRWGKNPVLVTFFSLFVVVWLDVVANSRTSELYIVALSLANVAYYVKLKNGFVNVDKMLKRCLVLILLSAVGSWALMVFFNPGNSVLMSLSEVLSNRLYSSWYYFQNFSVSLFGTQLVTGDVLWTGRSYALATLDNAYVYWLFGHGVLPTLCLVVGIVILFKRLRKYHYIDGTVIVFTLMCSLMAFCETSALSFDMNPTMLLLSIPIFGINDSDGGMEFGSSGWFEHPSHCGESRVKKGNPCKKLQ